MIKVISREVLKTKTRNFLEAKFLYDFVCPIRINLVTQSLIRSVTGKTVFLFWPITKQYSLRSKILSTDICFGFWLIIYLYRF